MIEPVVLIPGQMADSRLFLPQMVDVGSKLPMHVCLPTDGDTVEGLSQTPLDHAPQSSQWRAMGWAVRSRWTSFGEVASGSHGWF